MNGPVVQPLDCGSLTAPGSMFEIDGSERPVTLPVPAWLIRHPHATVLFDCGMNVELTRPGELADTVGLFFDVGLDESTLIARQLADRGVDPAEVDMVVLSHLHFDHSGGLSQLPSARVVVQRSEWAAGSDQDLAAANSLDPRDFDLGHDLELVEGEHDLLGDGSLTCLPTPGHTPGHQSLRVRLSGGDVVLCGDCAYFERTIDGAALPPIGHDLAAQERSLEQLRSLRRDGARLIPGHDAAVMSALTSGLS